jgi:peptidyl-prolyl cis-trans isomerase D
MARRRRFPGQVTKLAGRGAGHVWNALRKRDKLGVRVMLGAIVCMLGFGMLLYLVPGQFTTTGPAADVVAEVGGQTITVVDVRQQLARIQQTGSIPPALQSLYAQQVLNQLVFEKALLLEAGRLGIRVTDQERADRIRQLVPDAFSGNTFVGRDAYEKITLERYGLGMQEFEDTVSRSLIAEKFQQLATDGITVSPAEVEQEFRRRNEKVKLSYVVIKPDELQAKIAVSDADLASYFEKNKARYTVPERRAVRYGLLDTTLLRLRATVSDAEIQTYYNQNQARYKTEDRSHVAQILFKTVGMTDSQVQELQKKAEDVAKKAKSGGDFAALAKQSSEDEGTKDKGGDLGWIVRGQTVPEFESAAFRLPKGSVSDVIKTPYGLIVIKVLEQETARTQGLPEVRATILSALQAEKAEQTADQQSTQLAEEIRRAGRPSLDDLAKKFNLVLGEPAPLEAGQTIPEAGASPEIADTVFRLRPGDVSSPIRTDRGFVVIAAKQTLPSHPGTLAEVRERVMTDYRGEQAVARAKTMAADLATRGKTASDLAGPAKALGLEAKTSDLIARGASINDVGSASLIAPAFTLAAGQTGEPVFLGANWVIFRVLDHQASNPADLSAQRKDITDQMLQTRRQMAYDAFRTSLENRLKSEGKLVYNAVNLKQLTNATL